MSYLQSLLYYGSGTIIECFYICKILQIFHTIVGQVSPFPYKMVFYFLHQVPRLVRMHSDEMEVSLCRGFAVVIILIVLY